MAYRVIKALLLLFVGCLSVSMAQQTASEEQVKAAFIYNFAKFITWPSSPDARQPEAFRIDVLGKSAVAAELERAVKGKSIQGSRISVSCREDLGDSLTARIVFIPSDRKLSDNDIALLHDAHVLTVGESRDFIKRGGIIRFYLSANKVHFEINPESASEAGLEISSKLMRVACIYKGE